MGRHKGAGPAIELTEAERTALRDDIAAFGQNTVARRAGLSANGISLILMGKHKVSAQSLNNIRGAVADLKKIKAGTTDSAPPAPATNVPEPLEAPALAPA